MIQLHNLIKTFVISLEICPFYLNFDILNMYNYYWKFTGKYKEQLMLTTSQTYNSVLF